VGEGGEDGFGGGDEGDDGDGDDGDDDNMASVDDEYESCAANMAWLMQNGASFQLEVTDQQRNSVLQQVADLVREDTVVVNDEPTCVTLRNAIVAKGQTIENFAKALASFLGFQPVAQINMREMEVQDVISVSNTSYLSHVLEWGNSNQDMLKRFLVANFDHMQPVVQQNVDDVVERNCVDVVDIFAQADEFLETHTPGPAFRKYLTKTPYFVLGDPFNIRVPRYNPHQLAHATAGISERRLKAMQRGYKRMERLYTAYMSLKMIGEMVEEMVTVPLEDVIHTKFMTKIMQMRHENEIYEDQ
jgi:hypothetical protein